jgi:cobalt-zinc-cadmium efflux system protein
MGHDHAHIETTQKVKFKQAFLLGILLNVIYVVVEFSYGIIINSMALISDAGHNLSDVLGLILAWGATYLASKKPTSQKTYGYRKSTILASLTNAIILMIAVGAITYESIVRLIEPQPIQGKTLMIVAGIGVVINTLTALLFMKGRKGDLNIKGAFLHMAADAGVSLGVVAAGLVISLTNWLWIDPVISLIIVIVITVGTWGLLKESFNLSMDSVPKDIDIDEVREFLSSFEGVEDVHDLHIWAMSTTETALTAHLRKPDSIYEDKFIEHIHNRLREKFGIDHATIQIEKSENCFDCSMI